MSIFGKKFLDYIFGMIFEGAQNCTVSEHLLFDFGTLFFEAKIATRTYSIF